MLPRHFVCILGWLVVGAAGARRATAQTAGPRDTVPAARSVTARVRTVPQGPAIDGRLDETVWQAADIVPLAGFVQREPREGAAVSERTEVRVLATADALYVGAWLYDRSPELIASGERLRDAELTTGDYFGLLLDTYLDRQNGFVFATTPAGIEYDGQVIREGEGGGVFQQGQTRQQAGAVGGFNLNWDGSWDVATSRDSLGWYAEFRIPFTTLRYAGTGTQRWGANFARGIRRHNEEAFWSPVPRQFNLMRVSRAGTLDGIALPARRAASVTPYALGASRRDWATQSRFTEHGEIGVDAKLGVTPSLTVDLTWNTDFAQVEVDEQQTNLTRFPLFFPEKRPFFLENGGTFSAGTPQAVDLFFSRRIGIAATGQQVPIVGGGRLTGKVRGVTVGLLQLITERLDTIQPANSYTVGRLLRELPNRSRVGVIVVQRQATDDGGDYNRTVGVDGRIGIGEAVTVDAWAAATATPGLAGRHTAFSTRLQHLTRDWNNNIRWVDVGDGFNPEVGFLSRRAYRGVEATLMRLIRVPSRPWIRQLNPHASYRSFWDLGGFRESERLHLDGEVEFAGGGRAGPELNFELEGLTDSFTIAPGVIVPPGTYRFLSNGWDIASNPSAPLSFTARLDLGEFLGGHRWGGSSTVTWRHGAALTTSLVVSRNDVRLPWGRFATTLLGTRIGWFFTPRVFVQSLVQFSNQSDILSGNLRFGWLSTAGTGLYVVLNDAEAALALDDIRSPLGRSLTVKYTYQLNLAGGR